MMVPRALLHKWAATRRSSAMLGWGDKSTATRGVVSAEPLTERDLTAIRHSIGAFEMIFPSILTRFGRGFC